MGAINEVIQLRNSYKNILDYLCMEFEKRGVVLMNKPRKDFYSLGYFNPKNHFNFAGVQIEAKNFRLIFSFNSVFKNDKIEDQLIIAGQISCLGNIKVSTDPLPLSFLERENVLDILASFLRGEEYNKGEMWGWVNFLNRL